MNGVCDSILDYQLRDQDIRGLFRALHPLADSDKVSMRSVGRPGGEAKDLPPALRISLGECSHIFRLISRYKT